MRHIAELKLSQPLETDEVLELLTELKTKVTLLSYVSMQSSVLGDKPLSAYFTINAVDDGHISVEGTKITLSTTLNFTKLIEVYEAATTYLGVKVVDFVYPTTP